MPRFACAMMLAAVVATLTSACSHDVTAATPVHTPTRTPMIQGDFQARIPNMPAYLKLDIAENGDAVLLYLTALHLPPSEIEKLQTRLVLGEDGRYCLQDESAMIEQCLVSASDDAVVVRLRSNGEDITLQRNRQQL